MELSHSNSRGFSIIEYFKFKIILVFTVNLEFFAEDLGKGGHPSFLPMEWKRMMGLICLG